MCLVCMQIQTAASGTPETPWEQASHVLDFESAERSWIRFLWPSRHLELGLALCSEGAQCSAQILHARCDMV